MIPTTATFLERLSQRLGRLASDPNPTVLSEYERAELNHYADLLPIAQANTLTGPAQIDREIEALHSLFKNARHAYTLPDPIPIRIDTLLTQVPDHPDMTRLTSHLNDLLELLIDVHALSEQQADLFELEAGIWAFLEWAANETAIPNNPFC